jgi:CBS domain-containing protein
MSDDLVIALLKNACEESVGVIDSRFLCQSIGILNPKVPLSVPPETRLSEAVVVMQKHKVGCLCILDKAERLLGIFTERDVLKFFGMPDATVGELMTKDVMTSSMDSPIAYALNLMSHGGFRHLPIVDEDGMCVGIISVKDIVDYIAGQMTEALLK